MNKNLLYISVIIPYHNEEETIIYPLLSSLNNQQNIDFNNIEILFINNCDEPIKPQCLTNNMFNNIQSRIIYLLSDIKNLSGMSRQYGIINASGKYIMFCDDDDELEDNEVLCDLIKIIEETESSLDIIDLNENIQNEIGQYITFPTGEVLIHGRIYLTKFIRDNNISFSSKLRIKEDNFFNALVSLFEPKRKYYDRTIYKFNYNPNSVSRKNYIEFDRNCRQITPTLCEYLMDYVLEHNYEDKIIVNCLVILYGAYLASIKYEHYASVRTNFLKMFEGAIRKLYLQNKSYILEKTYLAIDNKELYVTIVKAVLRKV